MIEKSPILNFVTHAILLAAAFAMCFPIYVSLITATMPFERVAEVPKPLWPSDQLLVNMAAAWKKGAFSTLFMNSIISTLIITAGKIVIAMITAFALVYFRFRFRALAFWMIFITLMLPLEVRIVPTYEIVSNVLLPVQRILEWTGLAWLIQTLSGVRVVLKLSLIVMNKGRIEQVGRPADIYEKPASAFVASFLGSPPMNLIPATVDTDNRGIVFGDGTKIPLGHALPVAPGTEIVAGIRPEHVAIGNGHIVPVEFAEELGNGRQVHLRIGDMAVSALLPASDKQVIGETLAIKLPSEHLHFFGKDGRVIDVQPTAHTISKPETAERTVSVPALV